MAIEERDPHTGYLTTGHEWNGIIELNRPVPKVIWIFLASTVLFAIVYWILMPAWPLVGTYTRGLLGVDQRSTLAESVRLAAAERAAWGSEIETRDFAEVQADEDLMRFVRETGRTLFGDNCAACHGARAEGGAGFPRLTDDSSLWGTDPGAVAETIRVGINATHDETRYAEMLAFGRDGILDREAILDVVGYVRSLSGAVPPDEAEANRIAAGAAVFAENCVACHGETGTGSTEMGAPDLTDDFWIYGGDRQSVFATVYGGRQGHMPHWEGRLSPLERKIVTLFVLDLGEAEQ